MRAKPLPAKIDSAAYSKVGRHLGFKFGLFVSAFQWDAEEAVQSDSDAGIFSLLWIPKVLTWI